VIGGAASGGGELKETPAVEREQHVPAGPVLEAAVRLPPLQRSGDLDRETATREIGVLLGELADSAELGFGEPPSAQAHREWTEFGHDASSRPVSGSGAVHR
jgi:hypothetical protein